MVKVPKILYSLIGDQLPIFHDFGYVSRESEDEVIKGLRAILRMCHLGEHLKVVSDFEKRFASAVGSVYALGLGSGTASLYFALKSLGIGHGEEVITVANTFMSTITAIRETGAECRFVDIDKSTGLMDTTQLRNLINPRTIAIVPVHMYGSMVQMDKVIELAQSEEGLFVIEDACQAIGASYRGRHSGTWGDIGCFSFHITKLVGGPGDGGMIITQQKDIYNNIKRAALPNWETAFVSVQERIPSRLSPILVPILESKLKRLDTHIKRRHRQFLRYRQGLKDSVSIRLIEPPKGVVASHRNCIIVSEAKEKMSEILYRYRIPIKTIYPGSKVLLDQIERSGITLPQTRYLIHNHLSLPIGSHVSNDLIDKTIDLIKRAVN